MSYVVRKADYLAHDFRPERVANALLRETTTAQDTAVDVKPALTRLKYDIEEIERKMAEVCRAHVQELAAHAEKVDKCTAEVAELRPVLDDMDATAQKLARDFETPFDTAQRLHLAGERLHSAARLSRALTWYLQLALTVQSQEYARSEIGGAKTVGAETGGANAGGAGGAMLRSAHALRQLRRLLIDTPDLRQVIVVQRFEERVPRLTSQLTDKATRVINDFNPAETSTEQVKLAALALLALGVDVLALVETHVRALVGASVLQFSRNSATQTGYAAARTDAQARAATATALAATCNELAAHSTAPMGANARTIDGKSTYWDQVCAQLDQKLKTISLANPTAMRALVANRDAILSVPDAENAVRKVFEKYLSPKVNNK